MGTWPIEMKSRTGGRLFEDTEVREMVGAVHCPLDVKAIVVEDTSIYEQIISGGKPSQYFHNPLRLVRSLSCGASKLLRYPGY